MATVHDLDTFIQQLGGTGITSRMKYANECNRLSVRLRRKLIFSSRCEGWEKGPVYPDLYHRQDDQGDPSALTPADRAIAVFVFNKLRHCSGKQLSKRSHDFPEWLKSREGLADNERGNREITFADITEALSQELHIEEGDIACFPDSPEYISAHLPSRLKELAFFQQVLKPLLAA